MKINELTPEIVRPITDLEDVEEGDVFSGDTHSNSILPTGLRLMKIDFIGKDWVDGEYIYYVDLREGRVYRTEKSCKRNFVSLYESEVTLKRVR